MSEQETVDQVERVDGAGGNEPANQRGQEPGLGQHRAFDDEGASQDSADRAADPTADPNAEVERLEQEGEVAADFLERLLDIADLDGDIDVDVDGDRASVAIVDSDEGRVPRRLVGPDGRVLEALQELTRLAVQASTGNRSRLMLDVAGHRAERRADLVQLARTAIESVRATGQPEGLDPMTAFERKVVHDEVFAAGLVSESEGEEPHRHVVVLPARVTVNGRNGQGTTEEGDPEPADGATAETTGEPPGESGQER